MDPDPHPYFHSEETGAPFRDCISCGLSLTHDPGQPYLVAKSYRGQECIFEYAICEDCRANLASEFSNESQEALTSYFMQKAKLLDRSRFLDFGESIEPWIRECTGCGTLRSEAVTYSLGGILQGTSIVFDPYPICLCGKCEEEIHALLSPKTQGIWDDFVETHFDGPPGYTEDFPTKGRPALL